MEKSQKRAKQLLTHYTVSPVLPLLERGKLRAGEKEQRLRCLTYTVNLSLVPDTKLGPQSSLGLAPEHPRTDL